MATKELETTQKVFNEADEAFFGTVAKVADANDAFSKVFLILTHTFRVATDPEQASDILEAIHRFVSALDAEAAEQCWNAKNRMQDILTPDDGVVFKEPQRFAGLERFARARRAEARKQK